MRTVKWNPFLSGVFAILGGVFLWTGATNAAVTSDEAAAIVVFPKLVLNSMTGVDTVIQLSNTSDQPVNVKCFYVNANSHCTNNPEAVCNTSEDCQQFGLGGICFEGWQEIDFRFSLTARQPISWRLSEGLQFFPLDGFNKVGPGGQFNDNSSIPPASEDPFMGELKCIEVGPDEAPVDTNSLKGEATIVRVNDTVFDARGYNAVGIQALQGANDGDRTLVLGGDGAEYSGCPNVLILDHFFDDAVEPASHGIVRSDLTLVPCSENFELQDAALFNTTVQFLVFNEFEQRFSTSTGVRCFREIPLSDIDTRARSLTDNDPESTGDLRSIFNVNVQGTLTGQTRIRGTDPGLGDLPHGFGLIGVAEEFHRTALGNLDSVAGSAAFNLHQVGTRDRSDIIQIP